MEYMSSAGSVWCVGVYGIRAEGASTAGMARAVPLFTLHVNINLTL